MFVFCGVMNAQRNTFGTSWGLSEIGLSYGRVIKDDIFLLAGIHLETGETLAGRTKMPGAAASFTCHKISKNFANDNTLSGSCPYKIEKSPLANTKGDLI